MTAGPPPTLDYGKPERGDGRRGFVVAACFALGVGNALASLVSWGGLALHFVGSELQFAWARNAVWVPWLAVGPAAMVALIVLGSSRRAGDARLATWAERLNAACLAAIPLGALALILAIALRR